MTTLSEFGKFIKDNDLWVAVSVKKKKWLVNLYESATGLADPLATAESLKFVDAINSAVVVVIKKKSL